ncbi:MAG: NAD(P)/FAD-dependent oxidoreductase [Leptospira sp.]|uniref:NAD(P)/FAD-dependent oxidoreductase n=1 Tax=Leptospira paudalimensis TaxID=2950024 RepID=A0ABT3M6U1_9LEPT|nr:MULTISPECIES: NAD(P)/FAD-dependent oxidoreductase [Leptospira]MBL0956317.1 NAD(P)/FAD-dependent oxidoreductase [Leptospira sp.]MCW7504111.1 NAD(P)/FAD-dependent oxidoreductase [Leptospira paudalimensis]
MANQTIRDPKVVIIGAGMTGILLAIEFNRIGVKDITILEKKHDLGGTWRENTYPGVACDIPAHMYTYSFAPNPEWSHRFAHGDEIHAYFKRVSDEYKITPKIHFNEAVTEASYQNGKWTTKTSKGNTYVSDFLISATGILHHPAKPNIPGLESFNGKCFHTAEWDHSVNLEGKRIGIIGTGSTAAQVIPEMIKVGKKVSVFQRTPQWIVKVPDTTYTEADKIKWRKEPNILKRFHKWYTFAVEQTFSKAVIGKKIPHLLMSFLCKRNLRTSIKDPVLRKKLTPNYRVGCKRVIVNSTFYDAIQKPNADLVTEGIEKITEKGVVTKDGTLHELDVLILATGFHPFNFMRPMNLTGENGVSIESVWKKKVQAYRSLFIPHFPNFVLMLGPNTPIGNFSVIAMSEVQTKYIIKIIEDWRKGKFNAIDAKEEALQRFAAYLKKGMVGTVWLGGCQSWYLDPDGDPAMWPYTWSRWEKEMKSPDYQDFNLTTT